MPSFVDTNVFIHYLLGYDRERYTQSHSLLRAAEQGRAELETSIMVIAELIWFLERPPVRLPATGVRDLLVPILDMSSLRMPGKRILQAALELHAKSTMNFVDAYNTVLMRERRITQIYSYDTDFDGVRGVERLEP